MDLYLKSLYDEINELNSKMFDKNYKLIVEKCIDKINNIPKEEFSGEEITKIKDTIFAIILDTSFDLLGDNFEDYIEILRRNEIYKYKTKRLNRIIMKFFLKQYVILYKIKYNRFIFFNNKRIQKKISYFNNKRIQKKISYFNNNKTIKKLFPWHLYIDYVELVVTTKCTLKCKNCANLMYRYHKPYNVDREIIIKSIDKLFACADRVETFRILGGEPFCNPELKYILNRIPTEKTKNIVIVTNGTIVPTDNALLGILKVKNIMVEISDYGKYSFNKEKLINTLIENNIKYQVESHKVWYDYGDIVKYDRSKKDLERQFLYCNINCKSILNGKLYYCPRSAHGTDLNILKNENYVDLINNNDKTNRKEIKKLMFTNKSLDACKYCKYATKECGIVDVAEQLRK